MSPGEGMEPLRTISHLECFLTALLYLQALLAFFFFSSVDFTFSAVNFCIIKLLCCPQECNLHE